MRWKSLGLLIMGLAAATAATARPSTRYLLGATTTSQLIPNFGQFGVAGGPSPPQRLFDLMLDLAAPPPPGDLGVHQPPAESNLAPATLRSLPPAAPSQAQGRVFLFAGCGAQPRSGQPRLVDTATLRPGQWLSLTGFCSLAGSASLDSVWPAREGEGVVPPNGSLVGEHVLSGERVPTIKVRVDAQHDFLPPVEFTGLTAGTGGSTAFSWKPVSGALGYMAFLSSQTADGTRVIWSSSVRPVFADAYQDYVPTEQVRGLVREHVLLPATATTCTVPPGILQGTQGNATLFLIAYGADLPVRGDGWEAVLRRKAMGVAIVKAF